jgi:diadenosine tetraphosphate (Ap4A) HIT family hydrolase
MKCELCDSDGGTPIWRGEQCRVVHVPEPGYAGYLRVIWNAHVREMTDLSEAERAHCMRVVFAVESALRERLNPDKVNLASLGNVTPHLHWHVIARFRDDPHFPNAVWGAPCRPPATAEKPRANFIAALAATLSRL